MKIGFSFNVRTMIENQNKKIVKNLGWLTLSKIVVYILSILSITIVPRYLGVEAYGQLNFVLSFVVLFGIIGDLGLTTLIYRDVSKYPKKADEFFNNLFLFRLVMSFIMGIIMYVVILFLDKSPAVNMLLYMAILYEMISISNSIFIIIISALQKMKYVGLSEIISKLIYTLSVVLTLCLNVGVVGIMLGYLASIIAGLIFSILVLRKYIHIHLTWNWSYIKKTLARVWPFAIILVTGSIYFNIDRLYISLIHGDYQVGLYAISYTFYTLLISLTSILCTVFFPVIAINVNNKERMTKLSGKFLNLMLIVAVPMCLGAIYLSKRIITLVFGSQYVPGYVAFDIIMVFFLISAIDQFHSSILQIKNKEKFYYKLLIIASAANIILNAFAIPYFGIIGAAITTLISELIVFAGATVLIRKRIIFVSYFKESFKPLFSGIVMVVGLYLFDVIYPTGLVHNKYDVIINIFIGGAIYFLVLLLTGNEFIKDIRNLLLKK